jgi:hypothetical protein
MYELLPAYLRDCATPELGASILDGCEVLENAGSDGHTMVIGQILAQADNADTSMTINAIHSVVIETLRYFLDTLGVDIKDNRRLDQIVDLFRALEGLSNYEDKAAILSALDSAHDEVEALAQALELTGTLKQHDYIDMIKDVTNDLIVRIQSLNTDDTALEILPDREEVDRARVRLKRYIKLHPVSMTEDYIRQGGRMALDVDDIIDAIGDGIHDLDANRFGQEMGAICLASNLPNESLVSESQKQIQKFSSDIAFVTRANTEAATVITEATT